MAFRGIPFDSKMVSDSSGTYEDRQVFSEDFARYLGFISSDGICLKDDEELTSQLLVEAGTDSEVILNPGTVKIQGRMGWITEPESLFANPGGSLPRIDSAVIELNLSTSVRGFVFKIVEGEESSNPEPPILVRTPDVWQLGLGNFYRTANSTSLGQFTDTRLDSERCGISKVDTPNIGADTLTLWQESYPDITNLNDILRLIGSEGLPEQFGGTHSKTLPEARQNLNFIGTNPITSPTDDTPENWAALGTGHAYITGDGKLKNKPANNGIVESIVYGTLVIQVFTSWASGTTGRKWSRIGNNTYGWATSWMQLLDENTGVQKTLIWSNASPSSQFGAQTLSNVKWSDYDKIGLEYQYSDTNIDSTSEEVRPASGGRVLLHEATLSTSRVPQLGERTMVFNADGTISFTQAYIGLASGNAQISNWYCIPKRIWGIKGAR